jgi:hypothetical protein
VAWGHTFGGGYVELALELGVAPDRIDTIIEKSYGRDAPCGYLLLATRT